MLKQAAVKDVKRGTISRDDAYIVVTMRYYPRFLRKELRDEFLAEMAPKKELLDDFNAAQRRLGSHNLAFPEVDYESRFELTERGWDHLKRLSDLSKSRDVYLVCVCEVGDMCHREILMLLAHRFFKCQIDAVFNDYPTILHRFQKPGGGPPDPPACAN